MRFLAALFLMLLLPFIACQNASNRSQQASGDEEAWMYLFDGQSLDGWIPKIVGQKVGEDSLQTFRVVDSMIQVRYDAYNTFDNQFGHLFHESPFDYYILNLQYRFVGEQKGTMDWAYMNSGVMYHAQSPASMGVDQAFPVSLEGQFLGADAGQIRPTANLCTPGFHVMMSDTLTTTHCIEAQAPSFEKDVWVDATFIVNGGETSYHLIQGDTVLRFSQPSIAGEFLPQGYPDTGIVQRGYIALQSESHPIDFKNIRIKKIKKK